MARVLFTGGGSAGHVTPNLALMEEMRSRGWDICYVGSHSGIEKDLITRTDVAYLSISTGKLRRYFSWANFTDPMRIILGLFQALGICLKYRPQLVFSKGGFVSVPLVIAAWLLRIPVISHESDITPGLATRISLPFCRYLCVNFEETVINHPKVRVTGSPVRQDLLQGNADKGRDYLQQNGMKLKKDLPILLVFGGSLGADAINQAVYSCIDELLERFHLVHVCGEGNMRQDLSDRQGYLQREYIHNEFGDVLACADLVISRAGANSIYELLITRKPHILIPLTRQGSRGDQMINARIFEKAGYSSVIQEEELAGQSLNSRTLIRRVIEVFANRQQITDRLSRFTARDSVRLICDLIVSTASGAHK